MGKNNYSLKNFLIPTIFIGILVLSLFVISPFKENLKTPNENISYEVCFTPHQRKCFPLIQKKLAAAKDTVRVQSYSFTSEIIANALIEAHQRGVKVIVIADKSQARDKRSQVKRLHEQGIEVFVDYKTPIAHNKIITIGKDSLLLGSYNHTRQAERNAENLLFVHSQDLTGQYITNFNRRLEESKPLMTYLAMLARKGEGR